MIKCDLINFEKLVFESEQERVKFKEYLKHKGIFLHKQVYEAVLQVSEVCSYYTLSHMIRYDKKIRHILYKYLSAIEEKYRSLLYENVDICDKAKDRYLVEECNNWRIMPSDLEIKNNSTTSLLYYSSYSKHFNLSSLVNLLNKFDKSIIDEDVIQKLNQVISLRNKVMHHNLILLSFHTCSKKIQEEILKIQKLIVVMYELLPDEMKLPFEREINFSRYDEYANIRVVPEYSLKNLTNGNFD